MKIAFFSFILSFFFISCSKTDSKLIGKWELQESRKYRESKLIEQFKNPVFLILKEKGEGFSQKKMQDTIISRKIKWSYQEPFLKIISFSPTNQEIIRLWKIISLKEDQLLVGYGNQGIRIEHYFKKIPEK